MKLSYLEYCEGILYSLEIASTIIKLFTAQTAKKYRSYSAGAADKSSAMVSLKAIKISEHCAVSVAHWLRLADARSIYALPTGSEQQTPHIY